MALVAAVVWASAEQWPYAQRAGASLWLMVGLSIAAAAVAFVTYSPSGAIIVITPTVSFTFAIMLSWGLGPAVATQVAAAAIVTWTRRLPVVGAIIASAQLTLSLLLAELVIIVGDPDILPEGINSRDVSNAVAVVAAIAVWLATYCATTALAGGIGRHLRALPVRSTALGYALLFNAALIVLSPILSSTAQANPVFVPLLLIPLLAVQLMARLAAERDRLTDLDPLTGLANRSLLLRWFEQVASRPANPDRDDRELALMLLDLDHFKYVNDSLGHDVGDQLLIAVADRLRQFENDNGLVARLGGDEFAIVLPRCRPDRRARARRQRADRAGQTDPH